MTVLILSGAAKITTGFNTAYSLTAPMYYALAVAELVLAVGLTTAFGRWAATMTIAICGIGAVAAMVQERPCGCLGAIVLTNRQHAMLAAATGFFATLYLTLQRRAAEAGPGVVASDGLSSSSR
jgi:hypothetical protein